MKSAPRLPHQQVLSTTDTVGKPLEVFSGIVREDGTGPDLLPVAHRVQAKLRNGTS